MASIFSKILAGEIPSYKVAENESYYAFLDINPVAFGHTLVIPKNEVDYIFDLPDDEYLGLMAFSKRVAKALEKSVTCERIGITVLGLEVRHAHVHLVPLDTRGIIDIKTKLQFSGEEMEGVAESIAANFEP